MIIFGDLAGEASDSDIGQPGESKRLMMHVSKVSDNAEPVSVTGHPDISKNFE